MTININNLQLNNEYSKQFVINLNKVPNIIEL